MFIYKQKHKFNIKKYIEWILQASDVFLIMVWVFVFLYAAVYIGVLQVSLRMFVENVLVVSDADTFIGI